MDRVYHVAVSGNDWWEGSKEKPFQTITKAAKTAEAGDRVVVHGGTYREWVKPAHSGLGDLARIVYEAAKGETVIIKGSERIQDWERVEGTVWKCTRKNAWFGAYNPYKEPLFGDWFVYPDKPVLHTGDVYLNGKSFYEALSLEEVMHPVRRETGYIAPWAKKVEKILEPDQTIYQWYCESDEEDTTIYANFQGADPNEELAEINVRQCCFYPEKNGVNYITVRGFEMAQAACPWTPPTADQPGLLGPRWSKGWIIENNTIHDAKCSGISIGKEASTGHNMCTRHHKKPGYQYQMEAVFRALQIGWSKETIGSHIIRNNVIYDCGQNGIVGHMGGVFSQIYGNHIYNIAVKHEFFGFEIAGIKLHAAIDVQIHHNHIHHCTLGTWMDWQTQGTRISNNLYHDNDRDLMVEVSHGPYLVDNNVFASEYNFENLSQGGAFVHNLFCGYTRRADVLDRSTPYHFPHTTQAAGCAVVYGGDDRFFQNIFVGGAPIYGDDFSCGTDSYNGSPSSLEEYEREVAALGNGDVEQFMQVRQPVYTGGNVYLNGAGVYERECGCYVSHENPCLALVKEEDGIYLELEASQEMLSLPTRRIATETLGMARIAEAPYETPQGEGIVFDTDFCGGKRGETPKAGPFEALKPGKNRIKIWEK